MLLRSCEGSGTLMHKPRDRWLNSQPDVTFLLLERMEPHIRRCIPRLASQRYRMAPPSPRHRALPRALEQFTRRGNEEVGRKPGGFAAAAPPLPAPCNICAETGFKLVGMGGGSGGGWHPFGCSQFFSVCGVRVGLRGPAGFGARAERFCWNQTSASPLSCIYCCLSVASALGPRVLGRLGWTAPRSDSDSVPRLPTHTRLLLQFYSF